MKIVILKQKIIEIIDLEINFEKKFGFIIVL